MYKTILVHVDQSPRAAERIDLAARLALRYDAHLVGTALTGLSPLIYPVSAAAAGLPSVDFPAEALRADADRALDAFEARLQPLGVTSFERRRIDEEPGLGISLQGRYCDLVVISQSGAPVLAPRLRADFPQYVLLNCARPVLVVPASGTVGEVGNRITVAWNGSPNAIRALTSAIALMQRAQRVDLLVFNADAEGDLHGELPGSDIGLYLARHGVKVEVTAAHAGRNVGEALLAHARDAGSDLIVMGAYGHSRVRDILLGGATRTALRSSTLPLWMAH
jgi:nucleotide-binding universal stress UspA family protein